MKLTHPCPHCKHEADCRRACRTGQAVACEGRPSRHNVTTQAIYDAAARLRVFTTRELAEASGRQVNVIQDWVLRQADRGELKRTTWTVNNGVRARVYEYGGQP